MPTNVTGKQGSQVDDDGVTRLRDGVERLKKTEPSKETKAEVNALIDGCTLLHIAAFHGSIDDIRLLLRHGADPNIPAGEKGPTALHFAVSRGSTKRKGGGFVDGNVNTEIVITLLQYGANYGIKSTQYGSAGGLVIIDDAQGKIANPHEYSRFWELIEKYSCVSEDGHPVQFKPPPSIREWRKAHLPEQSDHSRRSSDSSESAGSDGPEVAGTGYWSALVGKAGGYSKLPSTGVAAPSLLSQARTWVNSLLTSAPPVDTAKKRQ